MESTDGFSTIYIWTILNIYSSHCKSIYIYIQNNIYYNIQHHWVLSLHHACLKGDSGDGWWSIYVLVYSICFSLSDLLYSIGWGLGSSTSLAYIILKIVLALQFQKGSHGPPSIFTLREPQLWQKGNKYLRNSAIFSRKQALPTKKKKSIYFYIMPWQLLSKTTSYIYFIVTNQ